jgi:peptidylprolyl isomerase
MRKLVLAMGLLASGPALATLASAPVGAAGLEIDVNGVANGTVTVDLFEDVAPGHVERITELAAEGAYDGVVFHRVIDGFMAQTGDVEFGRAGGDMRRAGMGGSDKPDLEAEFSDRPFERGVLGMARSQNPDSANSQFFIMFAPAPHLDGQYTVVGRVTGGMEIVDKIKRGRGPNGAVIGEPDRMTAVRVIE